MAKKNGVAGWSSMRKEELIAALVRQARKKVRAQKQAPRTVAKSEPRRHASTNPRILQKIRDQHRKNEQSKDLSSVTDHRRGKNAVKDRVVLMVRDAYWLHIYWEITSTTIRRAQVALADKWHDAQPTLRVLAIGDDGTECAVDVVYRDVAIHGGVNNWYVDIAEPPGSFRALLGYMLSDGRFHVIAKSNSVTTPQPNSGEAFDNHWNEVAADFERIYCLSGGGDSSDGDLRDVFEEKLRRPMATPIFSRFGGGLGGNNETFPFNVDAEMIIFGSTDPSANVTLAGHPIKIRPDGSFAVSMPIPDRRQVIPIVANSRDGNKHRTTVMAIERNTKVMEPLDTEHEEA
jgi:hypothetical protein